jgi:hypothetical protein
MNPIFFLTTLLVFGNCKTEGDKAANNPGNGNPLVPGYFADPTILKFGDTYYLYATTDGVKLASGEPQVWISKDFVNWYNQELYIPLPEGLTNCWAPDVVKGKDGRYYYYQGNCEQGCNIYGYVSATPVGPWARLNNGQPVIPAGTGIKDLPALDAQFMWDSDSSLYSYFGTWCTSFKGMGWAILDRADMTTIKKAGYIPIQQIPHAFEGAYALRRNSRYVLMYSSGDCRLNTYTVRYAFSDNPSGPFKEAANNPILESNNDGTIDSPGHHSVITEGGESYIVYHRHDNPHSTGGEFRQVCADRLVFENDSTISRIDVGHKGVGYLGPNQVPCSNLAYNTAVSATSSYHLVAGKTAFAEASDYLYKPEYTVDNNNGTLWKAGNGMLPQSITIDLGQARPIRRVLTEFEYPTFYYQYRIEFSIDNQSWSLFADKTSNHRSGCPMIDDLDTKARYLRITITGTEKAGMYAAIWNVKVYDDLFPVPEIKNREIQEGPGALISNNLLVDLNAGNLPAGKIPERFSNPGTLGGDFIKSGQPQVTVKDGTKAICFDGKSWLILSKKAPASLDWNSAYTAATWVCNPEVGYGECLMVWNTRENMLQSSYAALMYGSGPFGAVAHGDGYVDLPYKVVPSADHWHHVAVTFDGMMEKVYIDGKPDAQLPVSLFVTAADILIGASGEESENFSGYIARMQLFDSALKENEIQNLMNKTSPF